MSLLSLLLSRCIHPGMFSAVQHTRRTILTSASPSILSHVVSVRLTCPLSCALHLSTYLLCWSLTTESEQNEQEEKEKGIHIEKGITEYGPLFFAPRSILAARRQQLRAQQTGQPVSSSISQSVLSMLPGPTESASNTPQANSKDYSGYLELHTEPKVSVCVCMLRTLLSLYVCPAVHELVFLFSCV